MKLQFLALVLVVVVVVFLALSSPLIGESRVLLSDYDTYLPLVTNDAVLPQAVTLTGVTDFTEGSYVYIVGELNNQNSFSLYTTRVYATLYDNANQAVETEFFPPWYKQIVPGGKSPFKVIMSPLRSWSYYRLSVTYSTSPPTEGGLTSVYKHDFPLSNLSITPGNNFWKLTGTVRNNSSLTWHKVNVITTLYNASGDVVDSKTILCDAMTLSPWQSSPFVMYLNSPNLGSVTSHLIGTEGYRLQ